MCGTVGSTGSLTSISTFNGGTLTWTSGSLPASVTQSGGTFNINSVTGVTRTYSPFVDLMVCCLMVTRIAFIRAVCFVCLIAVALSMNAGTVNFNSGTTVTRNGAYLSMSGTATAVYTGGPTSTLSTATQSAGSTTVNSGSTYAGMTMTAVACGDLRSDWPTNRVLI